jgi:hypothetical protein
MVFPNYELGAFGSASNIVDTANKNMFSRQFAIFHHQAKQNSANDETQASCNGW